MQRRNLGLASLKPFAAFVLGLSLLAPLPSVADSSVDLGLIHVSIQVGSTQSSSNRLVSNDDLTGFVSDSLSFRSTARGPQLPDSLHFAGLAGALNLAIDRSNGRPMVEGIELAPREILSIGANGSGALRGLQGQISIRLDF